MPEAIATQIAERMRRWLVATTKATWLSEESFLCWRPANSPILTGVCLAAQYR
jgi:hypothetical protein